MTQHYKIFQFTSKNTGYYFAETPSLERARERYAKMFPKVRIDGPDGFFELYEEGEKTEWSN